MWGVIGLVTPGRILNSGVNCYKPGSKPYKLEIILDVVFRRFAILFLLLLYFFGHLAFAVTLQNRFTLVYAIPGKSWGIHVVAQYDTPNMEALNSKGDKQYEG